MATKKAASKTAVKKTAAKETAARKSSAKKTAARESPAKKPAAKKSTDKKYGASAGKSVEREMKAMRKGQLKSGSGQKVTNPKQAITIGLSEARKAGGKVPPAPPAPLAPKSS